MLDIYGCDSFVDDRLFQVMEISPRASPLSWVGQVHLADGPRQQDVPGQSACCCAQPHLTDRYAMSLVGTNKGVSILGL